MHNKTKIILFSSIIFTFPFLALADNASTTASTTPPATAVATASSTSIGLQIPSVPPLIAQIQNAKQLLEAVNLNYAISPVYKKAKATKKNPKPKAYISSYDLWAKDIALAVLDPATGQIGVTLGMQTVKTMKFADPNYDIKLTYFNGVNSRFAINKPAGGTILALKYLITGPESGNRTAIVNALSPVIYVPYSDQLNNPLVVKYGEDYLNGVIEQAAAELKFLPSQAIPGETLTQAIPPAMIKALIYAEHSDLSGNAQDGVNRLSILFATNGPDTYKYSVSNDGFASRGIAQFVGSTYTSLVQRHPEAGLMGDFKFGMEDHVNSVKAMFLLLDDYAGSVRQQATSSFLTARVFDYGAAAYNAGTTRVARAVATFGDNWSQDNSAQINGLQSQVNSLNAQVKSLKTQIKKAKDKKSKAALQSQLNSASGELNQITGQLQALQAASLRNTTVNYLQKIYRVIPLFNDSLSA
ncbi:MAG: hypothetical protein KGJ93_00310 [Patescibacteria group bacterium]|nr:hypothetical protein [Patescibacteria group bacterium]